MVQQENFTIDAFLTDLEVGSIKKFLDKYCTKCNGSFTSTHELSLFRRFPFEIIPNMDITDMDEDF